MHDSVDQATWRGDASGPSGRPVCFLVSRAPAPAMPTPLVDAHRSPVAVGHCRCAPDCLPSTALAATLAPDSGPRPASEITGARHCRLWTLFLAHAVGSAAPAGSRPAASGSAAHVWASLPNAILGVNCAKMRDGRESRGVPCSVTACP